MRRFSDFAWLKDQLREAYPFLIIPALPEKQQLGRFSPDFVEMRLRALQRWVERVVSHPELSSTGASFSRTADGRPRLCGTLLLTKLSPVPRPSPDTPPLPARSTELLKRFISMSTDAMASVREGNGAAQRTLETGKKTLVRLLKTASSVAQDAIATVRGGGSTAAASVSASTQDVAFAELDAYLSTQAPLVELLHSAAEKLAQRSREQAQLLLEFGHSLRALGTAEGGAIGANLVNIGTASWAASTTAYEQAVCQSESFVEKLADYVRDARSVRTALDERTRASRVLSEAAGEVDRLRAQLTALASSAAPTAMRDRQACEAELPAATQAATEARTYYGKTVAHVLSEVERRRATMQSDFRSILLDFVSIQLRTENKLAAAWEVMAAKMGGASPAPLAITLESL